MVWTLDGSNAGQTLEEPDCGPRKVLPTIAWRGFASARPQDPTPNAGRNCWARHQDLMDVAQGLRCGGGGP